MNDKENRAEQASPRQQAPPFQKPPPIPQTLSAQLMAIQTELNQTTNPAMRANLTNEMCKHLLFGLLSENLEPADLEEVRKLQGEFITAKRPKVTQTNKVKGFQYLVDGDEVAILQSPSETEGLDVARDIANDIYTKDLDKILIPLMAMAIKYDLVPWKGGVKRLPFAEQFKAEIEEEREKEQANKEMKI